ncbi:hypothetical protein QR680_000442 [Steinernema hermaphroditum]|uniref:Uncharacterized protein n=1 Tax=Steinernema hermaphroditum TaxID=289476 RepID=A0AA39GXE1_9BILA|nr:hypothetical protein QR680_000442 [Steinernema hermaphroditum]
MQERADFIHELAEHVLGPESEPEVVAQFLRTSTVRCKLSRKKCRRGRLSFMSSQNMFWGQNQTRRIKKKTWKLTRFYFHVCGPEVVAYGVNFIRCLRT